MRNEPGADGHRLAATMLEEVRAEIVHADDKAAVLVRALGLAFTVLAGGFFVGDRGGEVDRVAAVLWMLGTVAVIGSFGAAGMAMWPRMSRRAQGAPITYWGHLEGFRAPGDLAAALTGHGLPEPERTYQQLLVLAAVVRRKFALIRISMLAALTGALLIGAALLF